MNKIGKKKYKTKLFNSIEHNKYIDFLVKRLNSENYKANVTQEEYDKTKAKLDKAKLILKLYQK